MAADGSSCLDRSPSDLPDAEPLHKFDVQGFPASEQELHLRSLAGSGVLLLGGRESFIRPYWGILQPPVTVEAITLLKRGR